MHILPVATFLALGRGRLIPDDEHVFNMLFFFLCLACSDSLFFSFNRANSPQQAMCGPLGWLCGRLSPSAMSSPTPSCRMSRLLRIPESSSETKGGRYELLGCGLRGSRGRKNLVGRPQLKDGNTVLFMFNLFLDLDYSASLWGGKKKNLRIRCGVGLGWWAMLSVLGHPQMDWCTLVLLWGGSSRPTYGASWNLWTIKSSS